LHAKLHKMVSSDLTEMMARTGHALAVEDCEHIVRLNDLAHRYADPTADGWDVSAMPVRAGNLLLHPLTIGAAKWIEDCVVKWFSDNPLLCELGVGFALCHSREPEVLYAVNRKTDAIRTLGKFWMRCACTIGELNEAITRLMPETTSSGEAEPGDGYGSIISTLCKIYGNSPEHWLWNSSFDQCMCMLDNHVKCIEDDWRAAKRSTAKGQNPPPVPESMRARLKEYLDYRKAVEREWGNDGR